MQIVLTTIPFTFTPPFGCQDTLMMFDVLEVYTWSWMLPDNLKVSISKVEEFAKKYLNMSFKVSAHFAITVAPRVPS